MKNGLIRAGDHQLAHFAGLVLGVDDFSGGDLHGGIDVAALAHPFVVIEFAEIAHAGVGKQGDDEGLRSEVFGQAQGGRNAAAAGTSGEQAFQLDQAPGNGEAFLVVDLDHVVYDPQVHGGGEEILANAFDHVGLGFHRLSALYEVVVQRSVGVDTDDFNAGIFLFEIFAGAADGAACAHAANEVRDFAFRVFPDFRSRSAVMRLGIHGVVVLIGVIGIWHVSGKFFR